MRIRTNVKAGGQRLNHNERAVRVRTGVKAGGGVIQTRNHNERRTALPTRTGVRAQAPA